MTENRKRAIALGLFDGVHIGHRRVIQSAVSAAEKGFIPSVFTFGGGTLGEKRGAPVEYIYSDRYKEKLLESLGICEIFSEDFGNLRDMSGDEFAEKILADRLSAGYVVCGRDFRFGKGASCGVNELAELGRRYSFEVCISEDVSFEGEKISSKSIRELLKDGKPERSSELLGGDYTVFGEVVYGKQIGRTLDFPTINQHFGEGQLVPRFGVYATQTVIDGKAYYSVTNIGVKPTIEGGRAPLAETHILDYSGNLYGKTLAVAVKKFLRQEMKFNSLAELKSAISADIERCRNI
ncbi:MAG: riboflavin biosynthesis protein RibF [Ruminococcus sp.]|nr:riboflavin biosynthesis protein RibF [Ruminococcus sp.]